MFRPSGLSIHHSFLCRDALMASASESTFGDLGFRLLAVMVDADASETMFDFMMGLPSCGSGAEYRALKNKIAALRLSGSVVKHA